MNIAILLSGGKDSLLAAYMANKDHTIVCAITIRSKNEESYMYHTPNIDIVTLQAEAMDIPLIMKTTEGVKEKELKELDEAILEAKEKYGVNCIVTGAVGSQYQASRVQKICAKHNITCFNPLWQMNQMELLHTLLQEKFKVLIAGVFAYPFTKEWLGKTINETTITRLKAFQEQYQINPAGEGGEIETLVIDCPLFEKKIICDQTEATYDNYAGTFSIIKAHLATKEQDIIEHKKKEKTTKNISTKDNDAEILVITTHRKELKGFDKEFVRPILDIITEEGLTVKTIDITEITGTEPQQKIIITGTTFEDDAFLAYKERLHERLRDDQQILGICAGMELLLPMTEELVRVEEIGPQQVHEIQREELFSRMDGKECYFLHHNGIKELKTTNIIPLLKTTNGIAAYTYNNKEWYGTQFHPEVNQKQVIKKFLQIKK